MQIIILRKEQLLLCANHLKRKVKKYTEMSIYTYICACVRARVPNCKYSYFSRFGHQKAVLTNVLLKMGIIMLETC
jgi:hypothetical protein